MILPSDWYYLRWHAIAHNYQLSRHDIRMIYELEGEGAAAYAYWYPEEKGGSELCNPQHVQPVQPLKHVGHSSCRAYQLCWRSQVLKVLRILLGP